MREVQGDETGRDVGRDKQGHAEGGHEEADWIRTGEVSSCWERCQATLLTSEADRSDDEGRDGYGSDNKDGGGCEGDEGPGRETCRTRRSGKPA